MEPAYMIWVWKVALTALVGIGAITAVLGSTMLLIRLLDQIVERGLQLWAIVRKLPHTTRRLIGLQNERDRLRRELLAMKMERDAAINMQRILAAECEAALAGKEE